MFMYLINKLFWGNSEVSNSSESKFHEDSDDSSDESSDSDSISLDDGFVESRYGTPLSTVTGQHDKEPRNSSVSSVDNFVETIEQIPQISSYFLPFLNGPIFPEINEVFDVQQRSSSFSFTKKNSVGENEFEMESHFFHQTKILKNLDEKIVPLTMSGSCNTRDRLDTQLTDSCLPQSLLKHVNSPAIFEEEEECASDYVPGGYAPVYFGTLLSEKYYIIRKLAFGHFSTVWLAYNNDSKDYVAVKISRASYIFTETAEEEIRYLQNILSKQQSQGSERIVKLFDEFLFLSPFGTHHCTVLEPLGRSLYQIIVQSGQIGASLESIKKLAYQLLEGLRFLHDDCGIIHTDIKPENITIQGNLDSFKILSKIALSDYKTGKKTKFAHGNFPPNINKRMEKANGINYQWQTARRVKTQNELLKILWKNQFSDEGAFSEFFEKIGDDVLEENDNESFDIDAFIQNEETCFKIIDLGTAQDVDHLTSSQFQTLQYRSPEAVLRAHITPAIDIWSLACVLFEAATGEYLFNPEGDRKALDQNKLASNQFLCFITILGLPPTNLIELFSNNKIYNKLFDSNGKFHINYNFGKVSIRKHIKHFINDSDVELFCKLMERMLCYNPNRRGKASELLKFKWFNDLTDID